MRRALRVSRVLVLLPVLFSAALRGQAGQPVGPNFEVNTFLTDFQGLPAIAFNPDGSFVIVWQGGGEEPPPIPLSAHGVFGQRYSATGTPAGEEFRANTYTTSFQAAPAVASLGSAGFVVTWMSESQDGSTNGIFAQRFDASGAPAGLEFRLNTFTTGQQQLVALAGLGASGFVAVWHGVGGEDSGYGVYGKRFDTSASPVSPQFLVNISTPANQYNPSVAAMPGGGFLVAWQDSVQDGSFQGVYAQRFGANGAPVGPEFRVNTGTTERQITPSVAVDSKGGFVVAWADWRNQTGLGGSQADDVWAQRFGPDSAPLGSEFRVNTYITSNQIRPRVAADAAGDFVVLWESGGSKDVSGQRFSATGSPLGQEFRVHTSTFGAQTFPAVVSDPIGNFVVAWASDVVDGYSYNIWAQRFHHMGPGGDANGDGLTNVTDILYLINNLFAGGPAPIGAADADGNGVVNVSDILYLINYLFAGGPPPL